MSETPLLHAAAIEALYDETFGPGHFAKTAERLREYNQSLPDLNRVGLAGDRLVAATRLWPVQVERGGRAVFVGPVAVHPDFQGQRLGQQVTLQALEAARQAGWKAAILIGSPSYFGEIGFGQVTPGTFVLPGPQDPARILVADLAGSAGEYSGEISAGI